MQIEPRTLAHMSGDPDFSEPYIKDKDLYVQIASDVYGIPYENALEADDTYWREHTDLPKHPRDLAKVILLAVMYGISPYSLADSLRTTPEEAQQFINDFYTSYPVVREFMDEVVEHADTKGYVLTMFGRKRRFIGHQEQAKKYHAVVDKIKRFTGGTLPENVWQSELPYKLKQQYWAVSRDYSRVERQSVNAVIQGGASDILKRAMREVYYHLKGKDGWHFIGTIHDELLFEIPETATRKEIEEIEYIMTNTTKLNLPLKVDVEVMKRWGDGVSLDEWFKD